MGKVCIGNGGYLQIIDVEEKGYYDKQPKNRFANLADMKTQTSELDIRPLIRRIGLRRL